MAQSLEDFAHRNSPSGRCAVCTLPPGVKAQVDAAPDKGIGARIISTWLAAMGHVISRHQLDRHRRDSHS